jgi:hypothetical protein
MPLSIQAEESNNVIIGFNESIINEIDDFFSTRPTEKNVIWAPKVKGKSKYTFSIPKNAYLISKIHADESDLFYLSDQIDSGLKFHSNEFKNIDIVISGDNSNLILRQSILSDIDVGLFLRNKEKISFGANLNKDIIISKNTLGNFGVKQAKGEHAEFNVKFVKLSNRENSELYGNINHKYKSGHIHVGIGNTWFEILNQFDLTVGLQGQDKKVESEFYATIGDEKIKFQLGFDQIESSSKLNMFFNLQIENTLSNGNLGSNVIITSKESIFGLKKLSLKSFRKKNLDKLWKKYFIFN